MKSHLNAKRATLAALLTLSLAFAVVGFTPQGKGQKGGSKNSGKELPTTTTQPSESTGPKAPSISKTKVSKARKSSKTGVSKKLPNGSNGPKTIPTGVGGTRQSCVQSCNASHKNDAQLCKGRTGQDRADCQRDINEEHRLCIQSCPR